MRAFAITIVFFYHYSGIFAHPEWVRTVSKFGWTGVDLFFVLSGYLIAAQLFATIAKGERISFTSFFSKRFFRIIPAYVFVVALYFLFPFVREREGPAPLWKYLTFTQNFGLDLRNQGTFSHAWSLCIEEQFYLLLPLILIGLARFNIFSKGKFILIGLGMAGFAARLYAWHNWVHPFEAEDSFIIYWYKWVYYPTYSRLDGLLTGVSLAAVFQFRPRIKQYLQRYGNLFLLMGIVLLIAAYWLCEDEQSFEASVFGFPLISLAYGCIVASAVSDGSWLYRFSSGLTKNIAGLSYAVYLTHKMIIHITQEVFGGPHLAKAGNGMLVLCIITCLAGAWLLHKMVEKPFIRLRTTFTRK